MASGYSMVFDIAPYAASQEFQESIRATPLYPLFVNEAAYYEKDIAMVLTMEIFLPVEGVVERNRSGK